MFTAYFDASGTPREKALTLAGYISDARKWSKFETEWGKILAREKVGCFHMTDFASGQKDFKGWEPSRRGRFITELIECARRYTNKAFSATVVLEDYWLVDKQYRMHEFLGKPYSVCGRSCIGHVKTWARKHGIQQVAFMFEAGDEGKGDFQKVCREQEKIEPQFYGKKDFIPFQAADLVAWRSRQPIRQSLGDSEDFTVEEAHKILDSVRALKKIAYTGGVFDYRSFTKICTEGKLPRR